MLIGQPGIKRNDPDFFALLVGNHILGGGGLVSRLMEEVREKRGLTYGVSSSFSPGLHAGAFTVGLQTRPDQAEQARQVAHETLKNSLLKALQSKNCAMPRTIWSAALRCVSTATASCWPMWPISRGMICPWTIWITGLTGSKP